ncbi:MAG: MotA/TolQ/ExbB proton channel family protein [Acidobacteriota bacterium]
MTSAVELLPIAAAAVPSFEGSLFRLIADSGPVVKLVLVVLAGASVLSWTVIIERVRVYRKAEGDSDAFLRDLAQERRLTELRDRASRYAGSPLVPVFLDGFRELTSAVTDGIGRFRGRETIPDEERQRILLRVRRRLEESAALQADGLDRNLGILATTGSVTPFIGLFGTVWGIMNAFQGIGVVGSANLAAVAPGISEALVATAAGLFAAIPAVVAYNFLLARARRLGGRIERFVLSFGTISELQIESSRPPATPIEAGTIRA